MGKFGKDKRDIYYRMAKEEGYRARSAFKLLQIEEKFNILKDVKRCVDLCSAPGSWSQVLARKLYPNGPNNDPDVCIVSVDLQAMADIDGVVRLQGDITSVETKDQIIEHMKGLKADLVVCDGAPDVTGLHDIDSYIQSELLLSALNITLNILKIGGTFIAKIFRGKDVSLLYSQLKIFFSEVIITKPKSSRNSSIEAFAVCRDFKPTDGLNTDLFNTFLNEKSDEYFESMKSGPNRHIIPFVSCGDLSGFDSDSSYPLNPLQSDSHEYHYREPTQSPIDPPYKTALELKKSSKIEKPSIDIQN